MTAADASESSAWERLKIIAKIAYLDCDEAVAILAFLQAGNAESAQTAFRDDGHFPNLIRKAMLQRLVMTLTRLFDRPDKDRETLVRAFDLLSQPTIYKYACTLGDKAHLDAAIANWEAAKDQNALGKLRALRNFELAHSIPSKTMGQKSTYDELFGTAALTLDIVEKLAFGTMIVSVHLSVAKEIWDRRAKAYWSRLV